MKSDRSEQLLPEWPPLVLAGSFGSTSVTSALNAIGHKPTSVSGRLQHEPMFPALSKRVSPSLPGARVPGTVAIGRVLLLPAQEYRMELQPMGGFASAHADCGVEGRLPS